MKTLTLASPPSYLGTSEMLSVYGDTPMVFHSFDPYDWPRFVFISGDDSKVEIIAELDIEKAVRAREEVVAGEWIALRDLCVSDIKVYDPITEFLIVALSHPHELT